MYWHLNATSDPRLADKDRCMIKKISKTGNTDFLFLDGNKHWQSLTNKCAGELAGVSGKDVKRKIWWIKYHEKCLKLR